MLFVGFTIALTQCMKPIFRSLFIIIVITLAALNTFADMIIIPKGNTLAEIPPIPEVSLGRHSADLARPEFKNNPVAYYKSRYQHVAYKLLKNYTNDDFKIKEEILKVAKIYEIEPMHIFSAIVAEHVFNFDLMDTLQEYSLKLVQWKTFFTSHDEHPFLKITKCPEMKACADKQTENDRWNCYIHTYEATFKSKLVCGENYDAKTFVTQFFNPNIAGKTYGMGQLSPVKILSLTDIVHQKSGLDFLSLNDISKVYDAALDPKTTLHYIAAQISLSIQEYKKAGFDMSKNVGLTSTLYNLGFETDRARKLLYANQKNLKENKPIIYPDVNYYGWFANYIEDDLTLLFNDFNSEKAL